MHSLAVVEVATYKWDGDLGAAGGGDGGFVNTPEAILATVSEEVLHIAA